MARHNEIGRIGENIAAKWLAGKGFLIIEQNYLKKWGEIDIVARETTNNGYKTHFIEVKTVSYETKERLAYAVSHETWRPEENVHRNKIDRFKRVIQTWLEEHDYKSDWQIDIITVRVVPRERIARVKFMENIVFE